MRGRCAILKGRPSCAARRGHGRPFVNGTLSRTMSKLDLRQVELRRLLSDARPTQVFEDLLQRGLVACRQDFGSLLLEVFPKIDSTVVAMLWRWRRDGEWHPALSDAHVDSQVRRLLAEAGYFDAVLQAVESEKLGDS
jgi:hypothetical protein